MKKSLLVASMCVALGLVTHAQTTIMQEDFESGALPSGWSNSASPSWEFGTATGLSSQGFVIPSANSTKVAAINDDGCGQTCSMPAQLLASGDIDASGTSALFLSFDYFYGDDSYNGAQETLEVVVSTDSGSTWTKVEDMGASTDWDKHAMDLSSYAGDSIRIGFRYGDGGGWVYGAAIDNVLLYEPAQNNLSVHSIDMQSYAVIQAITITGDLENEGGDTVKTMTLSYEINGADTVTEDFSGLSIVPLAQTTYTFATSWTPAAVGDYDIRVWVDSVNGNLDADHTYDTVEFSVTIADSLMQRRALMEVFTSSTCPPCATWNPLIQGGLDMLNVNTVNGSVSAIKYQQDYPSPGTDPAYTAEGGSRHDYYGVTGIPSTSLGGSYFNDHPFYLGTSAGAIASTIEERNQYWSLVKLSGSAEFNGRNPGYPNLDVHVDIDPYLSVGGDLRLHVVAVENQINHNTQTNGETEFYHVMRKMLPNSNGTMVTGGLTQSTVKSYDLTYEFQKSELFVDYSNVTIVVFLQNNNNKDVLQSTILNPTANFLDTTGVMENSAIQSLFVYPNPSNGSTFIALDLNSSENVSVAVYNTLGELATSRDLGFKAAGHVNERLDLSDLNSGIYFVRVTAGDVTSTRKVTIK